MGQAEQLKNDWLRHRSVLEELLKRIGDEQQFRMVLKKADERNGGAKWKTPPLQ